ncbi:hypothetical protein [Paludibacterium purpuratum]|uniref:DUF5668 domain-containing protein n=1 Tax=Paludibacterium purpuratum TaxID=1144873 RepID=A0A4R7B9L1_9NEIS|nr:hypothetical protein [Paludibacterium purpuratum]TDR81518.1 hypothetical protein DFP86_103171 [Paludibacterium purpuratum]
MDYHRFKSPIEHRHGRIAHGLLGLALIGIGVLYALGRPDRFGAHSVWDVFPALIALSAAMRLATARRVAQVVKGVLRFGVAAWLYVCIEHIWGLTFASGWPFLMILFGASVLLRGLTNRSFVCKGAVQ